MHVIQEMIRAVGSPSESGLAIFKNTRECVCAITRSVDSVLWDSGAVV